mgnify:CR=1 FL=1
MKKIILLVLMCIPYSTHKNYLINLIFNLKNLQI